MKNALVLTSTFPRWKNDSTPSFVYDLCSMLSKKYAVTVLAPHAYKSESKEKIGSLKIHRFKYFYPKYQSIAYGAGILPNVRKSFLAKMQIPLFLFSQLRNAEKILKREKFSLLHAHWMIPQGLIGAYLKKKYNTPLIVTIHGSDLFPLRNKVFRNVQEFVLENADEITVNSHVAKKELNFRFPSLRTRISIIPMGIDTRLFTKRNQLKNQYQSFKIILFVGRLNEQKGVEVLIKAMKKIKNVISNSKLLVIGEGNYRTHLEKLVHELGLGGNVNFLGPIQKSKLPGYYSRADVFVLPSVTSKIGTESFGLVLLEAMSCGTCVIGSSSGGIKDIIKDGENGLIFQEKNHEQLADKIISVLKDDTLRDKLAKKGQKFARSNYGWDKITKKFLDVYGRVLK